MTIELNREAIARIAALPGVAEAAEAGSALISLWPLTEAMQMDNDAKYAENLQVRVTHAFARILTGQDVTMPDAEFVYEGADEIPGRPQSIVDTLLAANDAYDTMAGYSESGDVQLIFDAAEALGVDWDSHVEAAVRETVVSVEAQVEADAEAGGRLAASGEPADVAVRFATALAVCDALLNVVSGHAETVGLVGPAVAEDVYKRQVLSRSMDEISERVSKMIAGTKDGKAVTFGEFVDLWRITGILADAVKPAKTETVNGSPVYVHGGPRCV